MGELRDEHVADADLLGVVDDFAFGINGEGEASLEGRIGAEASDELLKGGDALLGGIEALAHEGGHAVLEDLGAVPGGGEQLLRVMAGEDALFVREVIIEIPPGLSQ